VLAPEKCLVLFDPEGGETLHELVHRHILELFRFIVRSPVWIITWA